MRTFLPELGVIDEYAEEIVNHRKQGIVAVYNIYKYDKEKIDAMQRWEQHLLKIVNSGNVDATPPPPSSKRILTDPEIKTVWDGLSNNPAADATCRALKMILVTGQAPGRCASLNRDDFTASNGVTWWKDDGNGNKICLTPFAVQLIGPGSGYAFVSRDSHVKIGTLSYFISRKGCFGIPKWTPIDLQLTVAAMTRELGATEDITAALEQGLMVSGWELKFWLEKWEAALLDLVK